MKRFLALTPCSYRARGTGASKSTDATRRAVAKAGASPGRLVARTPLPFTASLLMLIWLMTPNLFTQEVPPSNAISNAPPAQKAETTPAQLPPLLVQLDSGTVFVGLLTGPAASNAVVEYSPDLRTWHDDIPVMLMCLSNPPPAPPVTLIDRLKRSPGQNLRIIPLDVRSASAGYYRSKAVTVTNGAPLNSGSVGGAGSTK